MKRKQYIDWAAAFGVFGIVYGAYSLAWYITAAALLFGR